MVTTREIVSILNEAQYNIIHVRLMCTVIVYCYFDVRLLFGYLDRCEIMQSFVTCIMYFISKVSLRTKIIFIS